MPEIHPGRTYKGDYPMTTESRTRAQAKLALASRGVPRRRGRQWQKQIRRLQAALDTLPDAVFLIDWHSLAILDVNQTACVALGYSREQFAVLPLSQIAPRVSRMELAKELDTVAGGPSGGRTLRTVQRCRDGREYPVDWFVNYVPQSKGGLLIVVSRAVTTPYSGGEGLGSEFPLDSLTGLPERRAFDRRLAGALDQARQREDYKFAVLFLDLDCFKQVNDRFGHFCGDYLLREVALRLAGCLRPGDMVARRGGDEFTVLVDHLRDEQDAVGVAERIQSQLQLPLECEGQTLSITASIGIAYSTWGYSHPDALLRAADRAMYRVKASGRAGYAVFDAET